MTRMRRPTRQVEAQDVAPKASVAAELEILRLGAQGDGVAEGPAFVPFTLPGERVAAQVAGERGELTALLRASASPIWPAFHAR